MATTPSKPQGKPNPILPPRRGRIKKLIIKSLIGSASDAATKVRETVGKFKEIGSGGGSGSGTPPPSTDTSDGYSDHA